MASNSKVAETAGLLIIALIRLYRYVMSNFFGNCCRFEPSCSLYAIEAIKTHGVLKGCMLAFKRVIRCQPWHRGGIDPIP